MNYKNAVTQIIGKAFIFLLAGLIAIAGCAVKRQMPDKDSVEIKLPMKLRNPKMEFSAMAWDKGRLLLVPQFPDTFKNEMYALRGGDIDAAIFEGREVPAAQVIKVVNLNLVKKKIGPTYEGFESVVILGKSIYFTIESKSSNPNCFLVKGVLTQNNIVLDAAQIVKLPKLKRLSNAGYEAMAYSEKLQKLVIFFEYNKADAGPKALTIDTAFKQPLGHIAVDPLMYRLTDVAPLGNERYVGINYHFNASKTEFPEYIGADTLFMEPEMKGKKLKESSFNRLVTMEIGDKVKIRMGRTISLLPENWEGIVPYRNGVLLVTDTFPTSILKWFKADLN